MRALTGSRGSDVTDLPQFRNVISGEVRAARSGRVLEFTREKSIVVAP